MSTSQHQFDEYESLALAVEKIVSHLIKDLQPACKIYHWPTSLAYLADQRAQKGGAERPFCGVRVITDGPEQVNAVLEVLTKALGPQLAEAAQDPAAKALGSQLPEAAQDPARLSRIYASKTLKSVADTINIHKDLFGDEAREKLGSLHNPDILADLQVFDPQGLTGSIADLHPSDCQPYRPSLPAGGNLPRSIRPVHGDGQGFGEYSQNSN